MVWSFMLDGQLGKVFAFQSLMQTPVRWVTAASQFTPIAHRIQRLKMPFQLINYKPYGAVLISASRCTWKQLTLIDNNSKNMENAPICLQLAPLLHSTWYLQTSPGGKAPRTHSKMKWWVCRYCPVEDCCVKLVTTAWWSEGAKFTLDEGLECHKHTDFFFHGDVHHFKFF